MSPDAFHDARERMVRAQILGRGVLDIRVITAMRAVPREEFVAPAQRASAYADGPLPIGEDQTISQPYVVAAMLAALDLRGDEKVLEIGAGSGYAAALLGKCAREVWALERIASLAEQARVCIEHLGYANVHVQRGDGTRGLSQHAPFDAILVSAGGPRIPPALLDQLAPGGRLLMPVGGDEQRLVKVERDREGALHETRMEPVRFVPLIAG
ncbi:protein-L-isoaspartate(D-aspartate) O-methyltransferase [Sandaracinus amylolyticus]|uniref:Protein-L-isoaspartate O-methyltransferase n=1 Tax=Sandaracinus amylolyticus TaxID=927083 RepID=A0A0F6W3A4_9BACT|nr:protein-L-isoaspartate(D-aspartate) O-methyltransferase [Sandaracinus amylolyticus]AKF06400.1 Putative L-isoaspartate O-methyltransferase [Sandaracinus amylolyticus]